MKKQTIVYTQGVWDMFHIGHLNMIKSARGLGDKLVVGVNTDELVKEYKGYYPLLCWEDRAAVVEACKYVDVVIPTTTLEKDKLLEEMSVDIMVHGNDKKTLGHEYMQNHGKQVVYLPYTDGRSSSKLRSTLSRYYSEQIKLYPEQG
ncbi:MAG: adenylyltransferase/cytidyltransferase family protein [Bacteroidetes bacterium]|nr:adenylyltransferase/cytidyltransferase family protein [Bacteroidota bacterium]